ncbi:MAG TPA: hypothetical protein O0X70_02295 [Methanocorpusculum sp.]|nr:hypothetical protein [Methanocorpusculum sp.]
MHVSEGHLTQQYLCDFLTEPGITHEETTLHNLFIHRMSVDGGFHARTIHAMLASPKDKSLLLELLAEYADIRPENPPKLLEWLKYEYAESVKNADKARKTAASALLRSHISGINISSESVAAEQSGRPETYWQLKTRELTVNEIINPNLYLSPGSRPDWTTLPLDEYAAYLAGAEKLTPEETFDAVLCVAGAWYSLLSREEKLAWLNMPRVEAEKWGEWTKPLLEIDTPMPAVATAGWLYISGNFDAALDLYANITLAYPETKEACLAFQVMGEILTEFGDLDNAFEAYKQAFLLNRDAGKYETAVGLLRLCETGEKLGEHMESYYYRISRIAEELEPAEKFQLFHDLASSYRKKQDYANEYEYLEKLVSGENTPEKLFNAATSRLARMNSCMDENGAPDAAKLAHEETEERAFFYIARGDAAYFGFDPVCALYWYNKAGDYPVTKSRKFRAAVAAGLYKEAEEYAHNAEMRAMLPAMAGKPPKDCAQALKDAIAEGHNAAALIENAYILLYPDERRAVSEILCSCSTRNDEKARMCFAIGKAYVTFGTADDAKAVFRLGLRSNPSRSLREMIFVELAWLDYQTGDYAVAVEEYNSVLKLNERFPAAWEGLAKSLIWQGEFEKALEAAKKAYYYNPQSVFAQNACAALEVITADKKDAAADTYFALGEFGYAAALYAGVETAWDAADVAGVLKYRE